MGSAALAKWDHFIDGAARPPASGRYIDFYNPLTGEAAGQVAAGTAADVAAACEAAAAAAPAWAAVKPIERGRILSRIAALLRGNASHLAGLERAATGKPAMFTPFEVEASAQYFEFYAGLVNLFHGEVINLGDGYHSYTLREPFGVVGVVTPWNGPLNQAARGVAPALAAGNAAVMKPSEFTSTTTVELARLAIEAGMPKGVLNVVLGEGKDCGAALVSHPLIRKVAFTGSVRAGREIGHIAADRIIPLTLELGGKSANIIFEDADLSQAIPGAIRAIVGNSGQVCSAGSRLLVQRSVRDQVVEGLRAGFAAIKVGPTEGLGPMITRNQHNQVNRYLEVAEQDGAKLVAGGPAPAADWGQGWFVSPHVFEASPDMRIAREEIFGPVLTLIVFDDEAEAIRIANDTEFGLAAGLWTQNLSRAHRVAAALQAGQVYVNEYQAGGVETPFGGYKNSGYGREKGIEALHHYTQLKCVTIKL